MITPDWAARFAAKVNKNGPIHPVLKTRCHLWTACKSNGYGYFNIGGKLVKAHRAAFFLKHGRWPEPFGLHKCDVRGCVNDDHLFEGTKADNAADMWAKGRGPSGDRNGSRLHPERVARGDRSGPRLHPESRPRGNAHWSRREPNKVRRGKEHWTQTAEGRERLNQIRTNAQEKIRMAAKQQWTDHERRSKLLAGIRRSAMP